LVSKSEDFHILKEYIMQDLKNKKGLIIGIANDASIAFGCAKVLRDNGCTKIIATYLNEKAYPHVKDACDQISVSDLIEFNFTDEDSVEKLFLYIKDKFGDIDFVVHAMAFADKESLQGKVLDCSWEGFASSLHISSYSLVTICRHAKKIMPQGGAIVTMTYIGADRVIADYGIMGPIKACLESTVKYLSVELAEFKIRVFAVSPGPIMTRAASGINHFQDMIQHSITQSPMKRVVTIDEIGGLCTFLISDSATGMTGQTIYVDAGYSLVG
jgi:enoyl-[acyl-carrier protein] reductase I